MGQANVVGPALIDGSFFLVMLCYAYAMRPNNVRPLLDTFAGLRPAVQDHLGRRVGPRHAMYEPDHVDGDQYGQERHPRDRDVTSAEPQPVSNERASLSHKQQRQFCTSSRTPMSTGTTNYRTWQAPRRLLSFKLITFCIRHSQSKRNVYWSPRLCVCLCASPSPPARSTARTRM